MFEHRSKPLLPPMRFVWRLVRAAALSSLLVVASLTLGMIGYRYLNDEPWIDAFADASMILSGMGPVSTLKCSSAKLFAGSYALSSGIIFLTASTIVVAPVLHRLLHHLHLDLDEREAQDDDVRV